MREPDALGASALLFATLLLPPAARAEENPAVVPATPTAEAPRPEAAKPETSKAVPDKAAEEMARTRADLLAKHQGADEARLTQLMGPPSERATTEAGVTLTWRGPADAGNPPPCRLAAMLAGGALANLELSGQPAWDKKVCRKFLRPLLQALPWEAVHKQAATGDGSAASALVLGNDEILQMVKDGLPAQAILGRIRAQPCKFDISAEATNSLRRSGVPEVVIQAMIDRGCS